MSGRKSPASRAADEASRAADEAARIADLARRCEEAAATVRELLDTLGWDNHGRLSCSDLDARNRLAPALDVLDYWAGAFDGPEDTDLDI